jgi:hypothetical protein
MPSNRGFRSQAEDDAHEKRQRMLRGQGEKARADEEEEEIRDSLEQFAAFKQDMLDEHGEDITDILEEYRSTRQLGGSIVEEDGTWYHQTGFLGRNLDFWVTLEVWFSSQPKPGEFGWKLRVNHKNYDLVRQVASVLEDEIGCEVGTEPEATPRDEGYP